MHVSIIFSVFEVERLKDCREKVMLCLNATPSYEGTVDSISGVVHLPLQPSQARGWLWRLTRKQMKNADCQTDVLNVKSPLGQISLATSKRFYIQPCSVTFRQIPCPVAHAFKKDCNSINQFLFCVTDSQTLAWNTPATPRSQDNRPLKRMLLFFCANTATPFCWSVRFSKTLRGVRIHPSKLCIPNTWAQWAVRYFRISLEGSNSSNLLQQQWQSSSSAWDALLPQLNAWSNDLLGTKASIDLQCSQHKQQVSLS